MAPYFLGIFFYSYQKNVKDAFSLSFFPAGKRLIFFKHSLQVQGTYQKRLMDTKVETRKVYYCVDQICILWFQLLWHFLHLLVSVWYLVLGVSNMIESELISGDFLKRYRDLHVEKLHYLAIVIESEEARCTSKVTELLKSVIDIGVKHICLYDTEGVLKKSKEAILKKLNDVALIQVTGEDDALLDQRHTTLEFASISDGKEAVTKAANLLLMKSFKSDYYSLEESVFTETQMSEALRIIGGGGPDPDLLLVYGPTRCLLGFPAWRIRYTEIEHMGQLKYMRNGSLMKAIYRFSKVHQNYGN